MEKQDGDHDEIREVPLWEGLWTEDTPDGIPELTGCQCGLCGRIFFPPSKVCLGCISDEDLKPVTIKGTGTLYAYTQVKRGLPGYKSPYYLGSIDLDNNGPRVVFQLHDCGLEDLHSGMKMEACIGMVRTEENGTERTGPLFRPARQRS